MITLSEAKLECAHYMWEHAKDISYKLDDLQTSIDITVKDHIAKKICVLSSRQIGKSYWACVHAIEFLLNNPNKIARIIAPTLKQCGDIVQDNLVPISLDAPSGLILNKKSDYRWELSNGSSLRLGAMERAHVDGNRGGNASLVIYEECGFVNADDFTYAVNSVMAPQLLRSNGREIFVTSPSENPDHPLHTSIYPSCESMGTAFRYTVLDSPSITPDMILEAMRRSGCALSEEFIEELMNNCVNTANIHKIADATKSILSESFCREYLAEIIRPSTLMVVPAFNATKHIIPFMKPSFCIWNVTIDWGGVRDKTVALLHTYDFNSDIDLIWDEKSWGANTPTSQIVEELQDWEKGFAIQARWADVPGQLQVDLSNQFNYSVALPQKSEWRASVNSMAVRFATDRVRIHPRCSFLIKTLRSAMFNKNRTDFERSSELGHCDAAAALMYAIRSMTKENPYQYDSPSRDNYHFHKAKETDLEKVADAIVPRRFGRFSK